MTPWLRNTPGKKKKISDHLATLRPCRFTICQENKHWAKFKMVRPHEFSIFLLTTHQSTSMAQFSLVLYNLISWENGDREVDFQQALI